MFVTSYLHAVENCEQSGIILRISDEICITPVLVAKFILEAFLLEQQEKKMKEDELEQILQQGLSNEESDIIPPPSERNEMSFKITVNSESTFNPCECQVKG